MPLFRELVVEPIDEVLLALKVELPLVEEFALVNELELAPDEHPKEAGGESDSRQT